MLFFVSKELWQTVRYCSGDSEFPEIWRWRLEEESEAISVWSHGERRKLSALVRGYAESIRGPVKILLAGSHLTEGLKRVILHLADQPEEMRISVLLTSLLDRSDLRFCRDFLRKNPKLPDRISTFFFATGRDSDHQLLDEAAVTENYRSFLRLLCVGREELARSLGLFRMPVLDDGWEEREEERVPLEECSPFRETGIFAVLGVKSWLPRREEIVRLTEGFLAGHVAAEERHAISTNRTRGAEQELIIENALYLGMEEEPLSARHFAGMVPPTPDPPFERWRIPFSIKRARKQTHYLQRRLQRDFGEYTHDLEEVLDEIASRVRRQAALSFANAADIYREEMLRDADVGTLSWLMREYYPTFGEYEESALNEPDEATGWPPDESLDLFCDVYEEMDDGLDRLPGSKAWMVTLYLAFACFLAGGVFWQPRGWLPIAFGVAGLAVPFCVLIYRFFSARGLRRRLTEISEAVFESLQESFELELKATLHRIRLQLERDIRLDAIGLGERIRREFNEVPFVFTAAESEGEEVWKKIRAWRKALIEIGIDDAKVDPLPGRLSILSKKVIDRATREEAGGDYLEDESSPKELVEEWVDELVGASELPLEKVHEVYEEIVEAGSLWRIPALMAPLTDAELHRGFRKAVVLPNSDLIYQRLAESLPESSENAAVRVEAWQGAAPGIAACSVVSGLPESILDFLIREREEKSRDPVRPLPAAKNGERIAS